MTKRFANLTFGPFALRTLVRATLERDETVVGWAAASEQPSTSVTLLRLAMTLVPGVGELAAGVLTSVIGPARHLLLLTDRRLLVIGAGPGDRRFPFVLDECSIEHLRVIAGKLGASFTLAPFRDERSMVVSVEPSQSRPARQLFEALALLKESDTKPPNAPIPDQVPDQKDRPASRRASTLAT